MLAGDLSLEAFPSLLPMPAQVLHFFARCVLCRSVCEAVFVYEFRLLRESDRMTLLLAGCRRTRYSIDIYIGMDSPLR